jgi:hypothetical protein
MKLQTLITCLAVAITVGCADTRREASSSHHLTEAQVLAIAKPALPLSAGESYYLHYDDGVWKVWNSTDGSIRGGWKASTVLTIRDSDGKVLGGYTNL